MKNNQHYGLLAMLLATAIGLFPSYASAQVAGDACTTAGEYVSRNNAGTYTMLFCNGTIYRDLMATTTVSGNASLSIGADMTLGGTGAFKLAAGTTAQRPGAGVNGMIRYNADTNKFEGYQGGSWYNIETDSATGALPFNVYAATGAVEVFNYGGGTPTATFFRNIAADRSIAIGENAGATLTTGNLHNIFIGYNVAYQATDPDYNTIIGHRAAEALTTGSGNSILGWMAGDVLTSGYGHVLIGSDAGGSLTTQQNNTMVGAGAGSVSTGSFNVYLGRFAGRNAGSKNTHIGSDAGTNSTAADSVFIGRYAGESSGAANKTVYIGNDAGRYATAVENTLIGYQSGMAATGAGQLTGLYNTFVGYQTGLVNTSGESNTFVGYQAGVANTTGTYNAFFGDYAGNSNTTGTDNTFIGLAAGESNTTGSYKVFIGSAAGNVDVSVDASGGNTFVGAGSGMANTTGISNTFIGSSAGGSNITGAGNTYLGFDAGLNATTGYYNTFVGWRAGGNAVMTADRNVALGHDTGANLTTGTDNTFLGTEAGEFNTTGTNNVFVGNLAGDLNTTGSRNILIGDSVDAPTATTNDYLKIGTVSGSAIQGTIGTGNLSAQGAAWAFHSDSRLKDNIRKMENVLPRLQRLNGVIFNWKSWFNKDKSDQYGVIAQEVLKEFPEMVTSDKAKDGNEYYQVLYESFTPVLIEAIKEQQAEIESLRAKADRVDDLEARLLKLEEAAAVK